MVVLSSTLCSRLGSVVCSSSSKLLKRSEQICSSSCDSCSRTFCSIGTTGCGAGGNSAEVSDVCSLVVVCSVCVFSACFSWEFCAYKAAIASSDKTVFESVLGSEAVSLT